MQLSALKKNPNTAALLLRVGLAFAFLYASFESIHDPQAWASYLPSMLTNHVAAHTLLHFFSAYEFVLGVWLLSGWCVRYAALLCAATLAGIVFSDLPAFSSVTFRDVSLLFAALALYFL